MLEQPTKAGRADDLAHLERGLRLGRILAGRRQMVAGTVWPLFVVPGHRLANLAVQESLSHNQEVIKNLELEFLDDSFHVRT